MAYTKADHENWVLALEAQASDAKFSSFQEKLIPGVRDVIGVRVPAIRQIAKEILKGDWRGFLDMDDHRYHELNMLQAIVIAGAKCDTDERFRLIERFLPHVTNWAVNDALAMDMKCARRERAAFWAFAEPLLQAEHEYTVRFAIVMMLDHFLCDAYIERVLWALLSVTREEYYVRMALAWAYSGCFVEFADLTMPLFERGAINDKWVHNKAIQKTKESFRVTDAVKARLVKLKR